MHAIPAAFSCLTSLTLLSLGGQHYIRGGWRHLQPLTQLQCLGLSRARLPRMPRGLTALYGLPLRIKVVEGEGLEAVGADASRQWAHRFNERNTRLLQQRQRQQERTTAQPATQQQPSWVLRLLRHLAGGCARTAATE